MSTPPPPDTAGRRSIQRPLFSLAAGFILVTGCLVALALHYLRAQAIASGARLTETYAHVIAEQTTRTIQTVDLRLQVTANGLAQLGATGGLKDTAAVTLMREQLKDLPYVRAMWVLGADGRTVYDTDPGNTGRDFSDRAYFQNHRANPLSGFYFGAPVRSRTTGAWLISASRPMRSSDGALTGVIVAAVEPSYFDRLWRAVDSGEGGAISLFRKDGVLMMRSPFDDTVMGKAFPDFAVFRGPAAKNPAGSLEDTSVIDGVFRGYAYRTLSTQPELLVVVGRTHAVMLAPWRQLATVAVAVWAAASVAVAVLCGFLNRAWRQGRRSETRSEEMAQRLTIATDAAGIGVWDWDLKTDKWYATPTYFRMLGTEPPDGLIASGSSLELVHPDDRDHITGMMRAALAGADTTYEYEARVRHADGSYRWLRLMGYILARDPDGTGRRMLGIRMDITARKQAQEALEHARNHAENLISTANAMIVGIDREGAITLFNQAAQRITGYTAAEVIGRNSYEVLTPPERVALLKDLLKTAVTGDFGKQAENQIVTKSGQRRFISWQNSEIREGGQTVGILSFGIDITERKKAEGALRDSEERFRQLVDLSPYAIGVQQNGRIVMVNPAALTLFGATKVEDLVGRKSQDLCHPDERRLSQRRGYRMLRGETGVYPAEGRYLKLDGTVFDVEISATPFTYQGRPAIQFIALDITQRKLAEAALQHAKQYAEHLISTANAMVVALDRTGAITLFNQAAEQITGYGAAEVLGRNAFDIIVTPDRLSEAKGVFSQHVDGKGARSSENVVVTKSGQRRLISWQNSEIRENGGIAGMLSFGIDITEQHLAEDALRTSEERFRQMTENIQEVFWLQDPGKNEMLYISPAYEAIWGRSCASLYADAQSWHYAIHPEDRERIVSTALIKQLSGAYDEEYRIVRPDGSTRWVRDRASPVRDAQGNIYRISGVAEDITERRAAGEALRESELRYRQLVDLSPYTIGVHQDGKMVMVNPAAVAMFGATTVKQLEGRKILDLVHPDDLEQGQIRIERLLRGEPGLYPVELRYLRLDGSAFEVEASATPFTFRGRPAVQIIALDITQRKQAEAALRESTHKLQVLSRLVLAAQETERRRVAHELHDELGQALTAIKINLQARERFKERSPADLNAENLRIVEDAIKQVRRLALALRPSMLDDLGLVPALHWITEQTAARGGLAIHFQPVVPLTRLVAEIETACFRIVQEALTNIMRYARAKRVDIDLLQDGDMLVLCVQDDGCGFDLPAVRARALAGGSIGVLGMQERASLIGGQLEIASKPGLGTTIRLRCPWRTHGETI